jgi:hypothetical protein
MPKTKATTRANASATNIPKTDAALLTIAFDERSELRNSLHLSQISVKSWDIELPAFRRD